MSFVFDSYVGIDYSGAETAESSLKNLRVYEATTSRGASEVQPPTGPKKYWTRSGIARWLTQKLNKEETTLVGVDHGFSFPLQYFEKYDLRHDWDTFLDDFQKHWPTDKAETYVCFVQEGVCGNAAARCGSPRWRRITEVRARAKSVFHFHVPGSVAHSTHAGIPWLRYVRERTRERVHFWPFDGWSIPEGKSVVAEVYPALWNHSFAKQERTSDQHDAYAVAEYFRQSGRDGGLVRLFEPRLEPEERRHAQIEGWILGVL
ncbi:MAG TPA: hypothetical protein VKF79_12910 [Candidatus Acidoferrum sp.]|nr:hypothetical protein [Candidatus Acidoferrum sp.]